MMARAAIKIAAPAWLTRYEIKPDLAAWFLVDIPRLSYREARSLYYEFNNTPQRNGDISALGLADRYYLLTSILGRLDMTEAGGRREKAAQWLYERCREVEASPDGHLDLWFREGYKSTLITFGGTIQDLLRDPEDTFGIFSHTRPIAKAFLRTIKIEFEANALLKGLYPDVLWANPRTESPKWSEDEGLIIKRTGNPNEASIEAWGLVDGMPTGKHFKKLIYDDVVTRESVTSPEMIRKTTECLELSDNLGTAGGARRWIGTRYHLGDSYHTLIERKIVKPRIYAATDNGRVDGKPVFLTVEENARKLRDQPTTYPAQMLQNPAGGREGLFQVEKLQTYEVLPRTVHVYIMVDPAKGPRPGRTAEHQDRTAIAVVAIDAAWNVYLVDGYRHRMTLGERWEVLKALHRQWTERRGVQTVTVAYEQYGMQTDLEFMERQMLLEKYSFAIQEVNWPRQGGYSKSDRIARLVPDVNSGKLRVSCVVWHETHSTALWTYEGALRFKPLSGDLSAWTRAKEQGTPDLIAKPIKRLDENKAVYDVTRDLIEEMTFAPYGLHDDFIDALSRVYDVEPTPAQPQRRPETVDPPLYDDGM